MIGSVLKDVTVSVRGGRDDERDSQQLKSIE
jgi:hypothetical protein